MHPWRGVTRVSRRSLLLVGLLVLGLGAIAPQGASAHPGNVPNHAVGNWFYDNYGLGVYPPRYMRPYRNVTCWSGELVKWSPDLYRWNGSNWYLYDGSTPWYQAVTSTSGYCPFAYGAVWLAPNGSSIIFRRFYKLPAGYYAIKHYMYWRSLDRTHAEWSTVFQVYSPGHAQPAPPGRTPSPATDR
jgi:hypothetical protein